MKKLYLKNIYVYQNSHTIHIHMYIYLYVVRTVQNMKKLLFLLKLAKSKQKLEENLAPNQLPLINFRTIIYQKF